MSWGRAVATVSQRGNGDMKRLPDLPKIVIVACGGPEEAATEQGVDHKPSDSTTIIRINCFICRWV